MAIKKIRPAKIIFTIMTSLACILFYGCPEATETIQQVVQPPPINVADVAVSGISSKSLDLDLGLSIDNPNPIGLYLSGIDYDLSLAGRDLASASQRSGIEIQAAGASKTRIPLSLAYNEVKAIYDSVKGQDEIPYGLSGRVYIDSPIGEIPIPFQAEGMLPIIRPPKIKGVRVKTGGLSLAGADLDIIIDLKNPNAFALDIQDIDYALNLEGKDLASGRINAASVPGKSSGSISVPVSIDSSSAFSWLSSMIAKGSADYSLSYDATYRLDGHPIKHREHKQGSASFGR